MSSEQEMQNGPQPTTGGDQLCAAESRLSLPLELLAGEWLSNQRGEGAEETTYLMDSLLPTLVLGMEKLLTEVSKRGLEGTEEEQYDFNPVNLLAQYLMRNNPRHTHLPPSHPYCKQLRQVSQQLQGMSLAVTEKTTAAPENTAAQRTELD